jgi:hypothetical protein
MNIGKAAIAVFLILLLSFSLVAVLQMLIQDQSHDTYYNFANSTINKTINLTGTVGSTGAALMNPLVVVVAIIFLCAAFLIFRRL